MIMKKLREEFRRIGMICLTAVMMVTQTPVMAFAAEEQPAFEESETIDGVKITVAAEEGVFPEGAVLSLEKVTKEQEKQAEDAVEAERSEEQNVAASYTYDIKVLD